jgi:hypothetical protein
MESGLVADGADNQQVSGAGAANPYGCFGRTDRPHKSTHVPSNVNVISSSLCAVRMSDVAVWVDLYREKWWGLSRDFVASGFASKPGGTSARASAAGTCRSAKHIAFGYHAAVDYQSVWWEAATSNSASVSC